MDLFLVGACLVAVVSLYFANNPMKHSSWFIIRRFINWFPLGMSYAFLYMGRYNLNVSKNALGSLMSKEDFGIIFGVGTTVYALSFLINGPLVDKIGGKKGIIIATIGAALANVGMGIATWLYLNNLASFNLLVTFSILYATNMYFQSYGAVSIIKVKAYWFHVRERGLFGAIFGTLISFGVYFAFDWGQAIVDATRINPTNTLTSGELLFRNIFALEGASIDPTWLVFFIPSAFLLFWAVLDMICIKDTPEEAGFPAYDVADGSSDEMDKKLSVMDLMKKVFHSPVMLTIAAVEFTSGVLRNGVLQWYQIFAKETGLGSALFSDHWGLWLCFSGIFGSFTAGFISDKVFNSRRGPPAAIMNGAMFFFVLLIAIFLYSAPLIVGAAAVAISFAVIGVHGMMSGTAAADFGGRKATATCAGIVDGFVYLGSGLQSFALGYLTTQSWQYWPIFLAPFTLLGFWFSFKIWNDLPAATKKYLSEVEAASTGKNLSFLSKKRSLTPDAE